MRYVSVAVTITIVIIMFIVMILVATAECFKEGHHCVPRSRIGHFLVGSRSPLRETMLGVRIPTDFPLGSVSIEMHFEFRCVSVSIIDTTTQYQHIRFHGVGFNSTKWSQSTMKRNDRLDVVKRVCRKSVIH